MLDRQMTPSEIFPSVSRKLCVRLRAAHTIFFRIGRNLVHFVAVSFRFPLDG